MNSNLLDQGPVNDVNPWLAHADPSSELAQTPVVWTGIMHVWVKVTGTHHKEKKQGKFGLNGSNLGLYNYKLWGFAFSSLQQPTDSDSSTGQQL